MSIIESLFLGILQGIAEFLPISSSGHLEIAKAFLHLSDVPLLYDIILHLGTLVAVCAVYYKTIWRLICVAARFIVRKTTAEDSKDLHFILAILIATALTGVIGVLLKDVVEGLPLKVIALMFIITGILLLLSDKAKVKLPSQNITLKQAGIIGVVQGLAVFPGISRSGSTIAAGLFTGIRRQEVAEFSFVLSVPAILGALIVELSGSHELSSTVGIAPVVTGFIAAAVFGFLSLKMLTKVLEKARLKMFSFYLIPLGIIVFIFG